MAQGGAKSGNVPKGDAARKKKAAGTQCMRKKSGGKRKGAPAKQLKAKRDKAMTKMLHRNIERLAAARTMRAEGNSKLRTKDLKASGKEQNKIEDKEAKRKGPRSRAEAQESQLKNAMKKLNK